MATFLYTAFENMFETVPPTVVPLDLCNYYDLAVGSGRGGIVVSPQTRAWRLCRGVAVKLVDPWSAYSLPEFTPHVTGLISDHTNDVMLRVMC